MTWMTLKRLSATAAALLVCTRAFGAAAHAEVGRAQAAQPATLTVDARDLWSKRLSTGVQGSYGARFPNRVGHNYRHLLCKHLQL